MINNNGKAKVIQTNDGLSIIIPLKKNWFALLFATVWMGGWFFGFVNVVGILFTLGTGNAGIIGFIAFWLLAWTAGGVLITTILLWGYFGQEKFITNKTEILFDKTVFGKGIKKKLEISAVKNFRAELVNNDWFGGNRKAFWGLGTGKIKFDYGLKTFSFGLAVDDAEANYLVEILKDHFEEAK